MDDSEKANTVSGSPSAGMEPKRVALGVKSGVNSASETLFVGGMATSVTLDRGEQAATLNIAVNRTVPVPADDPGVDELRVMLGRTEKGVWIECVIRTTDKEY
jgi:hypothetical protein